MSLWTKGHRLGVSYSYEANSLKNGQFLNMRQIHHAAILIRVNEAPRATGSL